MSDFTLEDFQTASAETSTPETTESVESTENLEAEGEKTDLTPETPESAESIPEFDYSFEVKGEKQEIPEWLRGSIKSEDHHKELVDIFTKSYGLDAVKSSRDELKSELEQSNQIYNEQIVPAIQKIQEFDQAVNQENYLQAMQMSKMEPEKVMDQLLLDEKLSDVLLNKVADFIEQDEQSIHSRRQALTQSHQAKSLEQENTMLTRRLEALEAQAQEATLNSQLMNHQDAISSYDQRMGTPGAFRNFVDQQMELAKLRGQQLAPDQAIQTSLAMLGLTTPQTQASHPVQQEQITTTNQPTPVVPVVAPGQGVSPVSSKPATMDELKAKLAAAI